MPAKKKRPAANPLRRSPRLNKKPKNTMPPATAAATAIITAPDTAAATAIITASTLPQDIKHEPPKFDAETITKRSTRIFQLLVDVPFPSSAVPAELLQAVYSMIDDKCPLNCNVYYKNKPTQPFWLRMWTTLGMVSMNYTPEDRVIRGLFDLIRAGGGIPVDPIDASTCASPTAMMFKNIYRTRNATIMDCLMELPSADNDTWVSVMMAFMQNFLDDSRDPFYDALVARILTNMPTEKLQRAFMHSDRICMEVLSNGATRSVQALFARPEYVRNLTPFPAMKTSRDFVRGQITYFVRGEITVELLSDDEEAEDTDASNSAYMTQFELDIAACDGIVVWAVNGYLQSASEEILKTIGTAMPRELCPLITGYLLLSSLEWIFPPPDSAPSSH